MQYYDTGWFAVVVPALMVFFIVFNIMRSERHSGNLFVRRIPGLNAIDEAIGRATEMGRPVLMVPGIGTLNAISVQALNIFARITQTAAKFGTPIRICIADAAVYTVGQEIIKDVYQKEGMADRYNVDSVQFVSDRQFAFAAGVSGIIRREQCAATFFLGEFYAEALIFAESANAIGAIQVAGSTQVTQTPFFVAACDYVLIGDEFYAASAYLNRQPILVGSLIGQDWCKLMVTALIVFGIFNLSFSRIRKTNEELLPDGTIKMLQEPRLMRNDDTLVGRHFKPLSVPPEAEYERPQMTGAEAEEALKSAGGGDAGGGE